MSLSAAHAGSNPRQRTPAFEASDLQRLVDTILPPEDALHPGQNDPCLGQERQLSGIDFSFLDQDVQFPIPHWQVSVQDGQSSGQAGYLSGQAGQSSGQAGQFFVPDGQMPGQEFAGHNGAPSGQRRNGGQNFRHDTT